MRLTTTVAGLLAATGLAAGATLLYESNTSPPQRAPGQILNLVLGSPQAQQDSYSWLKANWQRNYTPMLLEALFQARSPRLRQRIIDLMETETGQNLGSDFDAWLHWLWQQDYAAHPGYAWFKGALYGHIDERFMTYFDQQPQTRIRLDEIRWGGVAQNGIPPLRGPDMIQANAADYLDADNTVFGVVINGDARAYPKRIMGHHEMFTDVIGGVAVAGVYCTLCGSMIVYETDGHRLGTSGFLYRSNKLMFDEATDSLWSTLWGRPVVGPLVDENINLIRHAVVTSTWQAWRDRHPATTVLDIDTGFRRDYAEGAAYKQYFATDELMFTVPQAALGGELRNKDEVLALREGGDRLAIAADFLADNRIYQDSLNGKPIVVLTDQGGANRAYAAQGAEFDAWQNSNTVLDKQGRAWTVTEDALAGPDGQRLSRIPAHRAFWFGWKAAFDNTRLVY